MTGATVTMPWCEDYWGSERGTFNYSFRKLGYERKGIAS